MNIESPDFYLATNGSVLGWGGGVSLVTGLGTALEERGYRTRLLGSAEGSREQRDDSAEPRRIDVPVRVPAALWRVRNWCAPRAITCALRRLSPPTGAFVGVNPFWVVAARRAWPGVPVVFGFAALLTNCLPFAWRRRRPTIAERLNRAAAGRAEHLACTVADCIVTPTCHARQEIVAFHPMAAARVAVHPYGCAVRRCDRAAGMALRRSLGLRDADALWLAVGLCDRNKAFDWAIGEWPAVDTRGHLAIVGDGPERAALAQQAANRGVDRRVHLAGSQAALDVWYAAADGVISTSHYDTCPYALLDGMGFGRPVVVPQHAPPHVYAGLAEIVAADGGGRLYDRRQPGALAAQVNVLIRDVAARRTLGRQAREVAERRFRWGPWVDRILEVSALGRAGRSPGTLGRARAAERYGVREATPCA